jgi:hypothetical protein
MKKLGSIMVALILFAGCSKNASTIVDQQIPSGLNIAGPVGIKLQTTFVSSDVSMNVKSDVTQTVTIKILTIANNVVSKSVANVQSGDNLLKLYTSAFPSSAYRIAVYDSKGNLIAITDFNKL